MIKQISLLVLLITLTFCLEGVTELNDGNFDELVKQDQSFWLVLFAADWVIYCNNLVWTLPAFKARNIKSSP